MLPLVKAVDPYCEGCKNQSRDLDLWKLGKIGGQSPISATNCTVSMVTKLGVLSGHIWLLIYPCASPYRPCCYWRCWEYCIWNERFWSQCCWLYLLYLKKMEIHICMEEGCLPNLMNRDPIPWCSLNVHNLSVLHINQIVAMPNRYIWWVNSLIAQKSQNHQLTIINIKFSGHLTKEFYSMVIF